MMAALNWSNDGFDVVKLATDSKTESEQKEHLICISIWDTAEKRN